MPGKKLHSALCLLHITASGGATKNGTHRKDHHSVINNDSCTDIKKVPEGKEGYFTSDEAIPAHSFYPSSARSAASPSLASTASFHLLTFSLTMEASSITRV